MFTCFLFSSFFWQLESRMARSLSVLRFLVILRFFPSFSIRVILPHFQSVLMCSCAQIMEN
uniref:Uncharacterized protein n=1 Tax=Arundo donax TaxID=35708 RepID=A0A0A9HS37_ARUDO